MVFKKMIVLVLFASMLLTSCAKKEGTESSQNVYLQPIQTRETVEMIETKTYEAEEQYVKMLGRTHNENGILWLAHSASGVEFTVRGTQCSVKIIGDSMIGV